jgi:tRNA A37 threonylcarbamoyltransferase TsaD
MIAVAGYYKFINEDFTNLDIAVKSRLKIGEI